MSTENETRYYLELSPYDKADEFKKHKCRFDADKKKWYTLDPNNPILENYQKSYINFKDYQKENFLFYDPENKKWYTYTSNKIFEQYII